METERRFYQRQRERLLAEGHEGRYVLIKGEELFGLFDTRLAARQAGVARFPRQAMFIHQVARQERTIRAGNWWR